MTDGREEVIGVPPEEPKQDDYPVYTYAGASIASVVDSQEAEAVVLIAGSQVPSGFDRSKL